MKSFLLILSFLTRIPLPVKVEYDEDTLRSGVKYLSLIGLLIGAISYGTYGLLTYMGFDRLMVVILSWLVYLILTGGLHMDGLADTFDGVFSNRDRDRILDIMKDSQIGTFGVLGIILVLLISITSSYYMGGIYFLIYPVLGRTLALIVAYLNDYARESGMGKFFVESSKGGHVFFNMLFLLVLSFAFSGLIGILGVIISSLITVVIVHRISKLIGGITGDIIGFSIEISQMLFLFSEYIINTLKLGF